MHNFNGIVPGFQNFATHQDNPQIYFVYVFVLSLISEKMLEFPSSARLEIPQSLKTKENSFPEHFQNCANLNMAGTLSSFRKRSFPGPTRARHEKP